MNRLFNLKGEPTKSDCKKKEGKKGEEKRTIMVNHGRFVKMTS